MLTYQIKAHRYLSLPFPMKYIHFCTFSSTWIFADAKCAKVLTWTGSTYVVILESGQTFLKRILIETVIFSLASTYGTLLPVAVLFDFPMHFPWLPFLELHHVFPNSPISPFIPHSKTQMYSDIFISAMEATTILDNIHSCRRVDIYFASGIPGQYNNSTGKRLYHFNSIYFPLNTCHTHSEEVIFFFSFVQYCYRLFTSTASRSWTRWVWNWHYWRTWSPYENISSKSSFEKPSSSFYCISSAIVQLKPAHYL